MMMKSSLMISKRQIKKWKDKVNRFKGKLVSMTENINGRFDHYTISLTIRQVLLYISFV